MTHLDKINTFIIDLKRLIQIENEISKLKTTQNITHPIDEYLDYGFRWGIIDSSFDLLKICQEIPELTNKLTDIYDKKTKEKIEKEKEYQKRKDEEYHRYAGTYDSLYDAPGYGSEWNERCIPDGVVIRNRNNRC